MRSHAIACHHIACHPMQPITNHQLAMHYHQTPTTNHHHQPTTITNQPPSPTNHHHQPTTIANQPPSPTNHHRQPTTIANQPPVGGLTSDATPVGDIGVLDISTFTWHIRRCSPVVQRVGHAAGYACGSLYVFGGTDGTSAVSSILKLRCSQFPQQSALLFDGDPSK